MEAFINEPNYTVWSDLSCNLGVLSSLLSNTDFHEEIQEFIRDLFTPVGLSLGWDSKPGEGEGRRAGWNRKPGGRTGRWAGTASCGGRRGRVGWNRKPGEER